MQNKYRTTKKKPPVNPETSGKLKKRSGIAAIAVLSAVIIALTVLLVYMNRESVPETPSGPDIPVPKYSDRTVYTEGIYSYILLDDGTVMLSGCDIDSTVTELTIPSEIAERPVTALSDSVFGLMTWLTSVTVPEGVEYIGEQAFSACGLEVVYLPSTLKWIQKDAFSLCEYIREVRYAGSSEEWKGVTVGSGNSYLIRQVVFE